MDGQPSIARNDVNRGLRDRIHLEGDTSSPQPAEVTLAATLNDLHELARLRFPTRLDDRQL
ncbi:MAG: hypothetical protein H0W82_07200 [Actinobacteria bacterium]|nr:hypothetical protein [Actinomycetota bacterium]